MDETTEPYAPIEGVGMPEQERMKALRTDLAAFVETVLARPLSDTEKSALKLHESLPENAVIQLNRRRAR